MFRPLQRFRRTSKKSVAGLAVISALAALATWVGYRSRQAGRDNSPDGQFIDVEGVRLHYVERGQGPTVLLIHGNNAWWRDFLASGLIDVLARDHRVISFDRPGYGHSERPRDRLWTPSAQAKVIAAAMLKLGIDESAVVGHSMGTLVSLALAIDYPSRVRSLTLLSGYHFPKLRLDALMTAPVALPVLGDVLRYTVTALSARAFLDGALKAMFTPNEVPANFMALLSREMLLRPVQLRANAEDAAFMMPAAKELSSRFPELRMPVTVIAGDSDAVVDIDAHSRRLHEVLPRSRLVVIPGAGHMVHYVAQQQIAEAVSRTVAVLPSSLEDATMAEPALIAG